MKNPIKKTTLLAGMLAIGSLTYAQTAVTPPAPGALSPPPPAQGQPGPMMANARPPKQHKRNMELRTLTTLTGKIVDYIANDRYVYDGFTLQTGSQTITVKFPGHMGSQMMRDAKKGSSITVNGFTDTDPQGVSAFHLVNAKAGGTQISDTPPTPPAVTATPELKNYEGRISEFKKDMQGNINGVILSTKEIVELPPHVIGQLQGLMKTGEKIAITGFKVVPPAGVVMSQDVTLIRPQTLGINGQTYLVR